MYITSQAGWMSEGQRPGQNHIDKHNRHSNNTDVTYFTLHVL